ncbi:YraN family protein [Eubacteriales bacterium OttesenSCG-928-N13]|nr:YraN family protein [Eubacteriales bacterium OttesenSCG-928-N13]
MNLRRSGTSWERVAEEYLLARGAKLLERNYRALGGEIDLIMKMDGATVFIEVKQRATTQHGTPGEAVNRAKQTRISRAALMYLKQNKLLDSKVRFDVVEILDGEVRHIKSAFLYRA